MRHVIPICAIVGALSLPLAAQDTTVESQTRIDADDATAVSLTGCLARDARTGQYTLAGTVMAAGDDVRTRTEVETDVDDDDVKVEVEHRAEADDAVGTSGTLSTFVLVPRARVELAPHVGKRVQVAAIVMDPDEKDAEVEIRERTNVDPDGAPDVTQRSRTEVEVENVRHGQYAVVSVKPLTGECGKP